MFAATVIVLALCVVAILLLVAALARCGDAMDPDAAWPTSPDPEWPITPMSAEVQAEKVRRIAVVEASVSIMLDVPIPIAARIHAEKREGGNVPQRFGVRTWGSTPEGAQALADAALRSIRDACDVALARTETPS